MKSVRFVSFFLTLCLLCTGCNSAPETPEASAGESTHAGQAAVSFPVDPALPMALVDLNGYETGGEKIVLFRELEAGDSFEIRKVIDDSVVYTGAVRAHPGSGAMCYGRFKDFQSSGSYYIYNDRIGTSYAFRIGADLYAELFDLSLQQMYASHCVTAAGGSGDIVTVCGALRDLLLSYEMQPQRFQETAESANGIPDVLDEAGVAVEWLLRMQDTQEGGILPETTVLVSGVLAKFAYVYGAFDETRAEEVLARGQSAWEAYTAVRAPLQESAAFAAAAELYRITGERKYEMVLGGFFSREDFGALLAEDMEIFYGSAVYLETNQPVNPEVCNAIRTYMEEDTARIAATATNAAYLVSAEDTDKLLSEALHLCVMNHFIFRQERVEIMENIVHYLGGRNPAATDYITESSENSWKKTGAQPLFASLPHTARLVLLLAAL
ncbi:MAG: glycoside hydrolase family 9 protein [Lachnospiraceae bacterium]|nr:glycoside hydrolase family 9 protein [Lachnospiraceae bacterium]